MSKKSIPSFNTAKIKEVGVVSLAIRPNQSSQYGVGGLTGKQLQERFDLLAKHTIEHLNEVIKILNSNDVASYISLGEGFENNADRQSLSDFIGDVYDPTYGLIVESPDPSKNDAKESVKEIFEWLYDQLAALNAFTKILEYVEENPGTTISDIFDAKISSHNSNPNAHTDIRTVITQIKHEIKVFKDAVNNLLNSDDKTLDQTKEIVAYIKNNKSLIDGITASKVNVDDIVDSRLSFATDQPLSANQGRVLNAIKVNYGDIVDNLTSTDKKAPLSANQGRVLDAKIKAVEDSIDDLKDEVGSGGGLGGSGDCTCSEATSTSAGLMSAADKSKLDGIAAGATKNTATATSTSAGLMSAADKAKLDGIEEGATAGGSGGSVDVDFDHIETINGDELKFFVGTKNEYQALSPEKKQNLFALFTDDIKISDVRGNGTGFIYTVPTSTNLDSFMQEGHYFIISDPNTPLNTLPLNCTHGFLDVDCFYNGSSSFNAGANVFKQTFRDYNTNDVYVRTTYNNQWDGWQKLIKSDDFATQYSAGLMTVADKIKLDSLSSDSGKIYRNDIKITGKWVEGGITYNLDVYLQIYRPYKISSNTSAILGEISEFEIFSGTRLSVAGSVGWSTPKPDSNDTIWNFSPIFSLDLYGNEINALYYDARNGSFRNSFSFSKFNSISCVCYPTEIK